MALLLRVVIIAGVVILAAGAIGYSLEAGQSGVSGWDAKAAANYLDGRAEWWTTWQNAARDRGTFCMSCHTTLPYALARPTLRGLSTFLTSDVASYPSVIVDLPPLLAGEPFVLPWAALLDQLFLVLREAATPLALARQALEKIGPGTPQIVLNRGATPTVEIGARLLAARA